jgi:hypothetical protein
VAGTLWALTLRYLRARGRRSAPAARAKPAPDRRPKPGSSGRSSANALGHRLASDPQLLEGMLVVRPNTIAVVLTADQAPQLKLPGELLRPNLIPTRRPVRVVVVNTAVTHLDVTVKDLVTIDGYPIDQIKIRLAVQVSDDNRYATLLDLVAAHSTDLDSHMLQLVQREVLTSLQNAVRMNRLADLRRQTLQRVLEDRWLPRGLAGGALVRRAFTVLESPSPTTVEAAPPPDNVRPLRPDRDRGQPSPYSRPAPPTAAEPRLDLTMDARLRRVWRDHANSELLGIAGAKESDGATVIAVPSRQPGAYEGSRLEEAFKQYYADGRVRVVSAVAESYNDLIQAWFSQVDNAPGRLLSVHPTADNAALRIDVHQLVPQGADREVSVGRHSDRQALRALLPHQRVEFVAADTSG